jgi:hypothetical protein
MVMSSGLLAAVQQTDSSGGFNVGTLLLFIGGAILLAFFCSIGVIARMRENRLEARRQAKANNPTIDPAQTYPPN